MTYRKNCNMSGECVDQKFCNKNIISKLEYCNNCPGCGCCLFCGESIIPSCNFPFYKYTSLNPELKQNDSFDLNKEVENINEMYKQESTILQFNINSGLIGGVPRISTRKYPF